MVTDLGLREARPGLRRAPRRAAGDHREAPRRQPRPGRADERHRRGPRAAGDHRRRRDRHGRHADRDRPRARARGRHRDLRLRHPRRPVRPGGRADPRLEPHARSSSPTRSRCRPRKRIAKIKASRSRRSSARRSSGSTAASPSARCSAARSSFTQEMLLWEDGVARTLDLRDERRRPASRRPASDPRHAAWPPGSPATSPETDEPAAAPARRPGRPRASGRDDENWRRQLRSPRWGAALQGRPAAGARNPEMNPTSTGASVAFWLVLGADHVRDHRRRLRHPASGTCIAGPAGTDRPSPQASGGRAVDDPPICTGVLGGGTAPSSSRRGRRRRDPVLRARVVARSAGARRRHRRGAAVGAGPRPSGGERAELPASARRSAPRGDRRPRGRCPRCRAGSIVLGRPRRLGDASRRSSLAFAAAPRRRRCARTGRSDRTPGRHALPRRPSRTASSARWLGMTSLRHDPGTPSPRSADGWRPIAGSASSIRAPAERGSSRAGDDALDLGSRAGSTLYSAGHAWLPEPVRRLATTASSNASSRSSTRPTSSSPSTRPSPTTRSASGSTSIRAEIREVAAPEEPSDDELHHPDLERRRELAKARRKRENERLQAALDDVLPEVVRRRPRGDEADARACATSTSS